MRIEEAHWLGVIVLIAGVLLYCWCVWEFMRAAGDHRAGDLLRDSPAADLRGGRVAGRASLRDYV